MAEKARREPPERTVESRGDRAVLAPATTRPGRRQRAGEEERGGGIGGYPVPLSMTMAGRAVASMASSSGESPPAHASAAAGGAGRRGIGVRRERGLAPPGAPDRAEPRRVGVRRRRARVGPID